jgi:hypothetical protein
MGSDLVNAETRLLCPWLLETKGNGRPCFNVIHPHQIKTQIFVVEENPGFHDKYTEDVERRVWWVKDMRSSWPLQFRSFAVSEYTREDEISDEELDDPSSISSDDETISSMARKRCCRR